MIESLISVSTLVLGFLMIIHLGKGHAPIIFFKLVFSNSAQTIKGILDKYSSSFLKLADIFESIFKLFVKLSTHNSDYRVFVFCFMELISKTTSFVIEVYL